MNFCVDSFFVLIFQLYSIIVSGKYAEVLCRRKKFFKPASFSDVDKSQKESLSFWVKCGSMTIVVHATAPADMEQAYFLSVERRV